MKQSILNGKRILAVDGEPDVLAVLEKEILEVCPDCKLETATTYQEGAQKMISWTYDAIVLGNVRTRNSDLLKVARLRNFPVAMLTTPTHNPGTLHQANKMRTRSCLPKERPGGIVSFLEDVIKHRNSSQWGSFFENLRRLSHARLPLWGTTDHRVHNTVVTE